MKILKIDRDGSAIAIPDCAIVCYRFGTGSVGPCTVTIEAAGAAKHSVVYEMHNDDHKAKMASMLDNWLQEGGVCDPVALYDIEEEAEALAKKKRGAEGFTLIELLTVIVILAIVGSLIASALHHMGAR